ncbi:UPF0481 protein At3g47200-like [Abrus precatorius]|uniref:UPF0481 protein At3g47200-like n=1 Tax=Abrus precatorius TaxID=3816 RepID=A0A8B8K0J5_ABRPR|nr:UPF0481 protein At3g47200-like [Abrus precatorius]
MQPDLSWLIPVEVMLGSLTHGEIQLCSIFSVPDEIRATKEDAFKPKVVSIGPLHRGTTRHLQLMEGPKMLYMREFLERRGIAEETSRGLQSSLEDCGTEILKLDKAIIASYGGNIQLESHELAKIMIVDGCFLLEFLLRLGNYMESPEYHKRNYSDDPIFKTEEKIVSIVNDITMLENQIPFIVLKTLYRKVFPHPNGTTIQNDYSVANIVRKAFGYYEVDKVEGAHVLHTMHMSSIKQNQEEGKRAKQELLRCATRLRALGITIRAANDTRPHSLNDCLDFNINFSYGELRIPSLSIKETTEVRWRNLIAWEQSEIWIRCKYTSYGLFFQGLICCKHDIEMLLEKKVIVNEANKSMDDLLRLFRTICKGAERMDSSYSELCRLLNVYNGKKGTTALRGLPIVTWHRWRRVFEMLLYCWGNWYRMLIRDHIPTVWKFIGVLAAVALLVLTVMQTYYSSRSTGSG